MTAYLLGRDAAYSTGIGRWDGTVIGYIGGPRADHVWAPADWATYKTNPKIPTWVGGMGGEPEGNACRDALRDLGVPPGNVVMLDLETRVDKTYVNAFYGVLHEAGFKVWVYGSTGTVFGNPKCNGYAVADPTGIEHMYSHPGVRMTQYAFGNSYDSDAVREWLLHQDDLWV